MAAGVTDTDQAWTFGYDNSGNPVDTTVNSAGYPPGYVFTFFTPAKDARPQPHVAPVARRMGGMGGTPMLLTLRALRSLAVKKRFRALSRIKVAFFQQIVPKALLHCLAVAEMAGESR